MLDCHVSHTPHDEHKTPIFVQCWWLLICPGWKWNKNGKEKRANTQHITMEREHFSYGIECLFAAIIIYHRCGVFSKCITFSYKYKQDYNTCVSGCHCASDINSSIGVWVKHLSWMSEERAWKRPIFNENIRIVRIKGVSRHSTHVFNSRLHCIDSFLRI